MIKAIFFDLDGTLLPMDQKQFVDAYLNLISDKLLEVGYEREKLIKTIWEATYAIVKNNGSILNEKVFWDVFANRYGEGILKDKDSFFTFYGNEFNSLKNVCGYNKDAKPLINYIKSKGYKLVLATNPVFPLVATASRMSWVDLNNDDFDLVTTYENSCYAKPNLEYYRDLAKRIGCEPSECLMIGNDVEEDMVAKNIGMKTFLLTDCLINKYDKDISNYDKGTFSDLIQYINNLCSEGELI